MLAGIPQFKVVGIISKRGWEPRYDIKLRLPEQMLLPMVQALERLQVNCQLKRERGRRVDTIVIRRRLDVLRICDIFPRNVPSKSKVWGKFIRLMEKVRNGEHMNNDSRYEFEMILNEDNRREEISTVP